MKKVIIVANVGAFNTPVEIELNELIHVYCPLISFQMSCLINIMVAKCIINQEELSRLLNVEVYDII